MSRARFFSLITAGRTVVGTSETNSNVLIGVWQGLPWRKRKIQAVRVLFHWNSGAQSFVRWTHVWSLYKCRFPGLL